MWGEDISLTKTHQLALLRVPQPVFSYPLLQQEATMARTQTWDVTGGKKSICKMYSYGDLGTCWVHLCFENEERMFSFNFWLLFQND